jgi:hypothetical protein
MVSRHDLFRITLLLKGIRVIDVMAAERGTKEIKP